MLNSSLKLSKNRFLALVLTQLTFTFATLDVIQGRQEDEERFSENSYASYRVPSNTGSRKQNPACLISLPALLCGHRIGATCEEGYIVVGNHN